MSQRPSSRAGLILTAAFQLVLLSGCAGVRWDRAGADEATAARDEQECRTKVRAAVQRSGSLATTGPYARVRHPQYAAFVLILLGFLFQWPTLLTLAMFPFLVVMYVRLARHEERQALAEFGSEYERYMHETPAFVPRLGPRAPSRSTKAESPKKGHP